MTTRYFSADRIVTSIGDDCIATQELLDRWGITPSDDAIETLEQILDELAEEQMLDKTTGLAVDPDGGLSQANFWKVRPEPEELF